MFYFIFSPNNSGTTIISQYLQKQIDGFLPPFGNFEGQMVPSVKKMMRADPWNPAAAFDWDFIRAEWEKLLLKSQKSIFIEASPPNLLRVEAIVKAFPQSIKALFSISNPYSQIASSIKNYRREEVTSDILREETLQWLLKAKTQQANIERWPQFPHISYEAFCKNPYIVNDAFGIPVKSQVDVAGKSNSKIDFIVDLSAKNITFLTVFEVLKISSILNEHKSLLDFFNYEILDTDGFDHLVRNHPALSMAGMTDRATWVSSTRPRTISELVRRGFRKIIKR